jgi:type I restriction enzyme, S subunit
VTTVVSGDRHVPWANDFSTSARLTPLKYKVAINKHVLPEDTDPDRIVRYIDIGGVDSLGRVQSVEEFKFGNAPSRARRLPRLGDTIVSTVRTYLRAIAFVEKADPSLVCSTGFAVVSPSRNIHPVYLAYWLRSDPVIDEICARSTGVSYPAINASEIGCIPVPVLPADRQRDVAAFLDRKTAAIDALIAKKERLIELLQEKRQALITQAVTKGLDPDVPMKPSHVEWLGDIPATWSVLPLKRFAGVDYGAGGELDHTVTRGTPIISLPNVTKDGRLVLLDELSLRELNRHEYQSCLLRKGDLLFNWRNGSIDHVGKTALFDVDGEFTHVSFLLRIRVDFHRADPAFLWLVLNGLRASRFFAASKFQVNVTYNRTELRQVPLPLPPIEDQRRIARTLRIITSHADALIEKTGTSLDKLREYRQALITAAVTGKIDVSNEAA